MEILLNIISLICWVCSVYLLFHRYGCKENIFSPLNLYILLNSFGIIISTIITFGSNQLIINILPSYFCSEIISLISVSSNNILYAFLAFLLYFWLIVLKYEPLKIDVHFLNKLHISKFEIFYLTLIVTVTLYIIFEIYGNPLVLDIKKMFEFRYMMSHGVYALLGTIFVPPVFSAVLIILFKPFLRILSRLVIFVFLIVLVCYGFFQSARGFFVFPILMAVFIFFPYSYGSMFKQLANLKVKYKFFTLFALIFFTICFYAWYSASFRGQTGHILYSVMERLDNFYASCLVIEKELYGLRPDNVLYPFVAIIPRLAFENKPYSPNAQISWELFGFHERWSVNFGAVGEALYVSYGILLPITSLVMALLISLFAKIYSKRFIDTFDLQLLSGLHTGAFGICMGGILTPATGNFLLFLWFYTLYKLIRRIKI